MTLRIVGWEQWQGAAVRKILADRRDRKAEALKAGRRPPRERPIALDFMAVSTDFTRHDGFVAFAGMVGGRAAETLWLRVLQFVGRADPEGGTLRGVGRGRMGGLVLARPWDPVSEAVGGRVWVSLVNSGLATETSAAPRAAPRAAASAAPRASAAGQDLDLEGETSNPVSDSAVVVDSTPPPAPPASTTGSDTSAPEASATAPEAPAGYRPPTPPTPPDHTCRLCDDLGRMKSGRCCDCRRGRNRALTLKKSRADEEASESKARLARSRAPSPLAQSLQRTEAEEAERRRQIDALRVPRG